MITTSAESRPSNAIAAHSPLETTLMNFCVGAIRRRSNANELFAKKLEMIKKTWKARKSCSRSVWADVVPIVVRHLLDQLGI